MAKERRPRLRTSLATASQFSSFRLHTATSAPARANSRAIDLPMPTPPPVTMVVLPSMENGFFAMPATIAQPRPATAAVSHRDAASFIASDDARWDRRRARHDGDQTAEAWRTPKTWPNAEPG